MNGAEQKNQHTTPSDLVYLFVDGEATDLERTMLFAALAEDVELQGELADAIRVNSAARQESLETLPPPAVTANLFRRAGVVGAASHTLPPVIPSAASPTAAGMSPDRGPIARGLKSEEEEEKRRRWGGFLFPIGGAVVGVLLTLLLMGDPNVEPVSEGRALAGGTHSTEEGAPLSTAAAAANRADGASTGSNTVVLQGRSVRVLTPQVVSTSELPIHPADADLFPSSSKEKEILTPETTTPSESEVENRVAPPAIDRLAEITLKPDELRQLMAEADAPKAVESVELEDEFRVEKPTNYSVFLRGAGTLGTWPPRDGEAATDPSLADAFAFGGLYHLDETHAIGLQGGRDHHPFYLVNDLSSSEVVRSSLHPERESRTNGRPDVVTYLGGGGTGRNPVVTTNEEIDEKSLLPGNPGGGNTNFSGTQNTTESADASDPVPEYRVDPTVEWVGVSYRVKGREIALLDEVRPIAQGTFGLSTVGPLGRLSLGLSWKPDDRVSLTAGVEGRALFYQHENSWYSSQQIGLEYGVEIDL